MRMRSLAAPLALVLAPLLLLAVQSAARAGLFCPKTWFCKPAQPCIKFKCVCPQPINPKCGLENFGWYKACWQPWPFPPDYSHCPVGPPLMGLEPPVAKTTAPSQEELPAPTKEQTEEPGKDQMPLKDMPLKKDQPPVKDLPDLKPPNMSQGNEVDPTYRPVLR